MQKKTKKNHSRDGTGGQRNLMRDTRRMSSLGTGEEEEEGKWES